MVQYQPGQLERGCWLVGWGGGGEWFSTSLASWSGVGGWGLDEVRGLGEFQVVRCLANREGWGLEVMGEDKAAPPGSCHLKVRSFISLLCW